MNRKTVCLASSLLVLPAVAPTGRANEVVEIQLGGHYFSEPATVRITVAVEPDADNRMLVIEADGDRFYRASELELAGADDSRLHSLVFKNLPAGSYQLRAAVYSSGALRGQTTQELTVTGAGGR